MKCLSDGLDYFILFKKAHYLPMKKVSPSLNNLKNNSYFKVKEIFLFEAILF